MHLLARNHRSLFTAVIGVLLLSAAPALTQTTFRYKFRKGDNLNYEFKTDIMADANVGGMVATVKMKFLAVSPLKVAFADNRGNATLQGQLKRVRFVMDVNAGGNNMTMGYDSKGDKIIGALPGGGGGNDMRKIKTLLKKTVDIKMNNRGRIRDLQASKELWQALNDLGPLPKDGDLKKIRDAALDQLLTFPTGAVTKGKGWSREVGIGKDKFKVMYIYDGPVRKDGKQLEKISLKFKGDLMKLAKAPVPLKLKNEKFGGYILFDNRAGRLAELTVNMSMEMDQPGPGGGAISTKIKGKYTLQLQK